MSDLLWCWFMFNYPSLCTIFKEFHLLTTSFLHCFHSHFYSLTHSLTHSPPPSLPPISSLPPSLPPSLSPTHRVQSQRVLTSPWAPSEAQLQRPLVLTPWVLGRGRPVPRRFLSILRVPNVPPPQLPPCTTSLMCSQTLTLQILIVDTIIETNTADCMQTLLAGSIYF